MSPTNLSQGIPSHQAPVRPVKQVRFAEAETPASAPDASSLSSLILPAHDGAPGPRAIRAIDIVRRFAETSTPPIPRGPDTPPPTTTPRPLRRAGDYIALYDNAPAKDAPRIRAVDLISRFHSPPQVATPTPPPLPPVRLPRWRDQQALLHSQPATVAPAGSDVVMASGSTTVNVPMEVIEIDSDSDVEMPGVHSSPSPDVMDVDQPPTTIPRRTVAPWAGSFRGEGFVISREELHNDHIDSDRFLASAMEDGAFPHFVSKFMPCFSSFIHSLSGYHPRGHGLPPLLLNGPLRRQ